MAIASAATDDRAEELEVDLESCLLLPAAASQQNTGSLKPEQSSNNIDMRGKIYLINEDTTLTGLSVEPYASEALLQAMLAQYPELLAGDQMNEREPRRWILVSRELGVPDREDGSDRWALDHLFLDQEAVPTLVEVKRSTDSRARREVVAQMLDYAANAVLHWPVDLLRARFTANCEAKDSDPRQVIAEHVDAEPGNGSAVDSFWELVKTNLRAGKIRLIFVADEIPSELKRIVEFLNKQMSPAEVLAVELKQFVGKGFKTLVPSVVGQTAEAQQSKSKATGPSREWDEASFFPELDSRRGVEASGVARQILHWTRSKGIRVWWGEGARSGSFVPILNHKGRDHQLFAIYTYGSIEIYFQWYLKKPPFESETLRLELRNRLNTIQGVSIPEDAITRRPSISIDILRPDAALARFLSILDWVVETIQAV